MNDVYMCCIIVQYIILYISAGLKFNFDCQKEAPPPNQMKSQINSFSVIDFGVNSEIDDQISLKLGFVPS